MLTWAQGPHMLQIYSKWAVSIYLKFTVSLLIKYCAKSLIHKSSWKYFFTLDTLDHLFLQVNMQDITTELGCIVRAAQCKVKSIKSIDNPSQQGDSACGLKSSTFWINSCNICPLTHTWCVGNTVGPNSGLCTLSRWMEKETMSRRVWQMFISICVYVRVWWVCKGTTMLRT